MLESGTKIFVTGGAGFIGSNFIRLARQRWPEAEITNFDLLTYAANPATLADIQGHPNYRFVRGDIRRADEVLSAMQGQADIVVHLAAETHVDRSILASADFVTSNVLGTHVLLEASQKLAVRKFVYVSTDEVYGSIQPGQEADEDWPLQPNSPYSASKAAGDMMVRAYCVTYGFPGIITRAGNNFGPYQYPEKFVSLFISNLLEGKKVPLYGDGLNVRDWIYVTDHCRALARVVEDGQTGQTYNVAGGNQMTNIEMVRLMLKTLGLDESRIEYVQDRPGHDRRYALNARKIREELGWRPQRSFTQSMEETIEWYRQRRDWWEPIKNGQFRSYYQQQYGQRLTE